MSMFRNERQKETYTKLERIFGIPGPSSASIRRHGFALLLAGLTTTTLLVVISRTTFLGDYCSSLGSNDTDVCLQLSSIIAVASCFGSFATISVLGIGLVEIITAGPWNEVQGTKPLAILVATWIIFVCVLCLLINQAFGV
jgi:hypothetical protein